MTEPRPRPRPTPGPRPGQQPAQAPQTSAGERPPSLTRALASVPRAVAHTARDTAGAARERRAEPPPPPPRRRWEPSFGVGKWAGALIAMVVVAAVLWAVQIADAAADLNLRRYGLRPRDLTGLRGIVIGPFVHGSYQHLLSNTVPFIAIGWVVMLAGVRIWALVTVAVALVGGLLTWVAGPSHVLIVGVSGIVFGWLGYLLARALFSRRIVWIVVAGLVLGFFSTLLTQLSPTLHSTTETWQAHLFGFLAGFAVGWALHPRGRQLRRLGKQPVS